MESHQVGGMPITGVTLYDNGYAVFERETTVQGHGNIDLYFSSQHMANVLESLQFLGEGGKKVGNIAYEATKPSASINLDNREPLVGLIRSLVGGLISLQCVTESGTETVEGRILGVDEKLQDLETKTKMEHVSILLEGGVMRTLPIKSIHSFHLPETQVQQDLAFSLDLVRNRNRDNMQKLSVFYCDVDGPQKLITRYGFKVNEWKSSYHMTLSDHPTNFQLEGLAIVENTLDEDWNDVRLTLVVGAPPIESSKATEIDQGVWELNIKALDGSYVKIRANPKDSVLAVKAKVSRKKGINAGSFRLVFAGKPIEDGRLLSDYTIGNNSTLHMAKVESFKGQQERSSNQSQFVMAAQDNLSFYPIPMHVTAKRKQKAIVPLLQVKLEGQKVVLYDETIRKGNPLSAILFENTTGRMLEGGSLQISTADIFLGQGTLPTLHPGDESPPIPFAVELGCEVVKAVDGTYLKPHRIEIVDGTVSIFRTHCERTLYRISNKSDKELDFLLNHLFLEDYDLVQNPDVEEEEPVDITDRFYQFRFVVNPKVEKKTFAIREEITDMKQHEIRDLKDDLLETWVRRKLIDAKTEKAIRETFVTKMQIDAIQKGIYEKESEIREITDTQERLRENISALEHHEKEAAKYIRSLSAEEDKLKALKEEIKRDRLQKGQLQKKLTSQINEIRFTMDFPRSGKAEDAK